MPFQRTLLVECSCAYIALKTGNLTNTMNSCLVKLKISFFDVSPAANIARVHSSTVLWSLSTCRLTVLGIVVRVHRWLVAERHVADLTFYVRHPFLKTDNDNHKYTPSIQTNEIYNNWWLHVYTCSSHVATCRFKMTWHCEHEDSHVWNWLCGSLAWFVLCLCLATRKHFNNKPMKQKNQT